jgi:hypothetical protein
VVWLEWFLNGILACLKAFAGSDAAARKNGSLYHFDINIPFLQIVFGGADFFYLVFLESTCPLLCVLCLLLSFSFSFSHSGKQRDGNSRSGRIWENWGSLPAYVNIIDSCTIVASVSVLLHSLHFS